MAWHKVPGGGALTPTWPKCATRLLAPGGLLDAGELASPPKKRSGSTFPRPAEYFADPKRDRPYAGEPIRRRRGVPVPLLGPEPAGRAPRPRRCRRTLPRNGRTAPLQGRALGESPEPSITTSRSTATTAATASWYHDPRPAISRSGGSSTCRTSPRTTGHRDHPLRATVKDVPFSPLYLRVRFAGRPRGPLHWAGRVPAHVPDRHPPPRDRRHRYARRARFSLLADFQVRHDVGRQDGVAEAVARALGKVHPAVHRAPARPLRLAASGRSVLGRKTLRGRRRTIPGIDWIRIEKRWVDPIPAPRVEIRRASRPPSR